MRRVNPNFLFLRDCVKDQQYNGDELISGKRGALLVGSSRSGKTISSVDFIIYIATRLEETCTINVVKETYNEFKTTLYDDFKKRLDDFGLDNPFHRSKEISTFKVLGVKVNFIGADKLSKFHGVSCDYLYINEGLPIKKGIFDQLEMRCRKFWWIDFNPSVTQHWIFDSLEPRNDVGVIKTTFLDNPFISTPEKVKILSYEPWQTGSYEIIGDDCYYNGEVISESNQPPVHSENVENGTADEYMWKVYGLGLKGSMEGLIFKNVTYIDELPDMAYTYGMDFGFSVDPCTLVRHAEDSNNIYLELLIYQPIETPSQINDALEALEIERDIPITADSSDKYTSERHGSIKMVQSLFSMGWTISKVRKSKNVMFWLNSMREKKIHIVKNHLVHFAKKEQENYCFKEINGIAINQPVDNFNHFWDGSRYSHMAHNEIIDIYAEYN